MEPDAGIATQTWSKLLVGSNQKRHSLTSTKTSSPSVQRSRVHGQWSVGSNVVKWGGLVKSVRTGLQMATRSKPSSDHIVTDTDCQECDFHGATTQALYRHMKQGHPHVRPYLCVVCGLWFNTPHD